MLTSDTLQRPVIRATWWYMLPESLIFAARAMTGLDRYITWCNLGQPAFVGDWQDDCGPEWVAILQGPQPPCSNEVPF